MEIILVEEGETQIVISCYSFLSFFSIIKVVDLMLAHEGHCLIISQIRADILFFLLFEDQGSLHMVCPSLCSSQAHRRLIQFQW